jgi:hypothetical protein
VELPRAEEGSAYAYVGDAGRLNADAEWPGAGDLRTRVERYLSENDVVVIAGESG